MPFVNHVSVISRQVDKHNVAKSALNPVKAGKGALKTSGMSSKTVTVLKKIRAHLKEREKRAMTEKAASSHNRAPFSRTPIPVLSSKTRLLVSETASPNSIHRAPSVAPTYQNPSVAPAKQTPAVVPMYQKSPLAPVNQTPSSSRTTINRTPNNHSSVYTLPGSPFDAVAGK